MVNDKLMTVKLTGISCHNHPHTIHLKKVEVYLKCKVNVLYVIIYLKCKVDVSIS